MQSDRKKILTCCIAAAVFIICVIAGVTIYINSSSHKLARQLSLGQKYLEALDYEQAVLAYNTALRIDEKEPKAYIGLAKVYAAGNKLAEAESILQKGLAVTNDSRIRQMLENVQNELVVRNNASGGASDNVSQPGTQQAQSNQSNQQTQQQTQSQQSQSNQTQQPPSQSENGMPADDVSVVDISSAKKGEYIRLGAYEQDGNTSDGKEAVCWLVLDEQDDRILVISKDCLDVGAFKKTAGSDYYHMDEAEWYTSDLRQWLNEDFINETFTTREQDIITVSQVSNSFTDFNKNSYMFSEDRIFCLSVEEAKQYFFDDSSRRARVTVQAKSKGASSYQGCTSWWLRSVTGEQKAACVLDTGKISEDGTGVGISTEGIRPAMWIKRENVADKASEAANASGQSADSHNLTREEMNERILAHYNEALGTSGEYNIQDYESIENEDEYVVTLRYNQNWSDDEIARFRAEGIWPSVNVISGTVTVNKKTGEVTYEFAGQKSDEVWNIW